MPMLVTWQPREGGDPGIVLAVCYHQIKASLLKWIPTKGDQPHAESGTSTELTS